tara:strand:- start:9900 stop:10607 length:708 start_codon:yes stop_codon:yes gene_type:complete
MNEQIAVDKYHDNKPALFFIYDNCYISSHLKQNIIWEKHLHNIFEKYITPNSIVIEGGCHIGTHTIKLGMLAEHVYAFEPMPSSYNLLKQNAEINNLKNITVIKKGLSNTSNKVYFDWIPHDNPGGSGLSNNPMGKPEWIENDEQRIPVDLTTIDLLNLERLDFIKLDVEGYESLAISGGLKTIQKYKPVITLEVWSNHSGGVDINYTKNTFKDLIDIGYTVVSIGGPDFLFIPN